MAAAGFNRQDTTAAEPLADEILVRKPPDTSAPHPFPV